MLDRGDYLYIHYGDLYKGFDVRIDVEDPQKPIPYIADSESIRKGQWLRDQDIVYVLTSETVEDLGHAFLFSNPKELPRSLAPKRLSYALTVQTSCFRPT